MLSISRSSRNSVPRASQCRRATLLPAFAAAIPAVALGFNYSVDNTNDSGPGSLRQEITNANANPGSQIVFNIGQSATITLQSPLPQITAAVTINGGSSDITINGQSDYRLFFINDTTTSAPNVTIENLNLANGFAQGGNGGSSGGGGLGAGGGIFVGAGNVSLSNISFTGSAAHGGNGGNSSGANSGGGGGGGLGGAGGSATTGAGGGGGGGYSDNGSAGGDLNGGNGGGYNGAGGGAGGAANDSGVNGNLNGGGGGGGSSGNGGVGGFYGGGGGAGVYGASPGAGGFGGGGGAAAESQNDQEGGGGGFGGGGGASISSLGLGNYGGAGGTGGGTGGSSSSVIAGGGGGGAAFGAAVFIQQGATISFTNTSLDAGTLTAGTGGSGYMSSGEAYSSAGSDGATAGSSLYLMGGNTTFNLSGNLTSTIAGSIAESAPSSLAVTGPGTLVLSGNNSYSGGTTIANGATVSISSIANLGAATGAVTLAGGTLMTTTTLSTPQPIIIDAGTNAIDVAPGATAALSGAISGNGTLNKTGTGTLVLVRGGSFGGPLDVNAGMLSLGSALPSLSISVLTGATLQLQHGAQINTSLLALAPGSTLDITSNPVSFNTSASSFNAVSLVADLRAAYNGGAWNGTSASTPVITSSLAQASHGITTLGYLVIPSGLDIGYTFPGDTDLNGTVNAADLANLNARIGWDDFNYDGKVNADDYALFMLGLAESGGANISTTLPEPSIILASGFWLLGSSSRRRRN